METLLKLLAPIIMQIIESILNPENIRKYADRLLDLLEDIVTDTETEWDDITVLSVLTRIREAMNIPDND